MRPLLIFVASFLMVATLGPDVSALKILSPTKAFDKFPNGTVLSPPLPQFLPRFAEFGPVNLVLQSNLTSFNSCVLVISPGGIPPDVTYRRVCLQGPTCIIAVANFGEAGVSAFFRDMSDDVSMCKIPVVEISSTDAAELVKMLNDGDIISINVTDSDPNPWDATLTGGPAIAGIILIGVPAIINVLIAIFKMQAHVRVYGCKPTIAQSVFWIDIVANLLRIWYSVVSRSFYTQVLFMFSTMTSSLSWPLNIISALLVSIKWHELTNANNMRTSLFLSTHRKPFLTAAAIIFLIELISSSLRGLFFSISLLSAISWALLVICSLVVILMLWVFGTRVLRHLAKVKASGATEESRKMTSMRKATMGMMVSGGFLVIVCIAFIASLIISSVARTDSITASTVFVIVTLLSLNLASMVQLLSFPTPSAKINDIGGTRSSYKSTNTASSKDKSSAMSDQS